MTQQISIEAVFPTFRRKCGELFDANMILQAQVEALQQEKASLQQQLAEAQEQLTQAQASQQPLACTDPKVDALP